MKGYTIESLTPLNPTYLVCSSQGATKLEQFFLIMVYDSVCITKIFYSYCFIEFILVSLFVHLVSELHVLKWACGQCNGLVTEERNLKENFPL